MTHHDTTNIRIYGAVWLCLAHSNATSSLDCRRLIRVKYALAISVMCAHAMTLILNDLCENSMLTML